MPFCLLWLILVTIALPSVALSATAREIDVSVDVTLERFEKEVNGGREFLESAKGVLVFPNVVKAGFGVGGEYGEGALRIEGRTVDYYNTVSASIGFQLGAQVKSIILVFMTDESLNKFRRGPGWEVGVDGSVALVKIGVGGEYGEGALRIEGRTVDYYNTVSASIGFQLGAQVKSIILVFMTDESLNKFRRGPGWEVGVDGSVALVKIGAGGTIDTTTAKEPIVAFVFGQKGLMYNLTLEGSKFTKLEKKE